jgi:pimeloyl-ACP methyl ester carboxylesterase
MPGFSGIPGTSRALNLGHNCPAIRSDSFGKSDGHACSNTVGKHAAAKALVSLSHPLTTARMAIRRDINQSLPALRHLFFSSDTPKEKIERYMAQMQAESNRVFKDIARISDPNPQNVQPPVLILAAEQDRIPKRVNERLAKSFSAEFETLPVAHDVMLTPKWRLAADSEIAVKQGPSISCMLRRRIVGRNPQRSSHLRPIRPNGQWQRMGGPFLYPCRRASY